MALLMMREPNKSEIKAKVRLSMKPELRFNKTMKFANQNDSMYFDANNDLFLKPKFNTLREISTDLIEVEQAETNVEGRANRLRLIVNEIINQNTELISNPSNIKVKWWK